MFKNPIKWKKLGRIVTPRIDLWWNQTHMALPTVEIVSESIAKIYFAGRDIKNRAHIGYVLVDMDNLDAEPKFKEDPVLGLGELGTFDDNGVMPCSIIDEGDKKLLYYVGWNPKSTTRFSFFSNLAISNDGGESFERYSRAPIIDRTDKEPFVNASPYVIKDGDVWRMYYVSGEGWVHEDLPKYNIKYAESRDGRNWERDAHVCVDFSYPGEHALARPCVLKDGDIYRMWFSYKGSNFDLGHNYRVGYAESEDGKNFVRRDDLGGIDVSEEGWDSEMVTYSFVFEYKGKKYMAYNGNTYGYSGIGLAVEA